MSLTGVLRRFLELSSVVSCKMLTDPCPASVQNKVFVFQLKAIPVSIVPGTRAHTCSSRRNWFSVFDFTKLSNLKFWKEILNYGYRGGRLILIFKDGAQFGVDPENMVVNRRGSNPDKQVFLGIKTCYCLLSHHQR